MDWQYSKLENTSKVSAKGLPKNSDSSLIISEDDDFDVNHHEQQTVAFYRTTGDIQAAFLMLLDYTSITIMNYPYLFNQLGCLIGTALIVFWAIVSYYNGIFIFLVCRRFDKIKDFTMFSNTITKRRSIRYFAFAVFFAINIDTIGLHIQQIVMILNTLTNHGMCTAVFAVVVSVILPIFNIPRTLSNLTSWSVISTISFMVCLILTIVFASNPQNLNGYSESGSMPFLSVKPVSGRSTSFYFSTMLLSLSMPFGHFFYPSFIYEMKRPDYFKNCLKLLLVYQLILYNFVGFILSHYMGQYAVSPAISTLRGRAKKITYPFILPIAIFVATLACSILAKTIFHKLAGKTRHYNSNSLVGWVYWLALVITVWAVSYLVSQAIPVFGLLVSFSSALCTPTIGLIMPSMGFLFLRNLEKLEGKKSNTFLYYFAMMSFVLGIVIMGFGLYSSIKEISIASSKGISKPFSCDDNSL